MNRQLLQISLPLSPSWEAIELIRGSVLACVNAAFFDPALAARMGLVAGELMENAVKFGGWRGARDGAFALRVCDHHDRLELEVSSPVIAGDPHLARLAEALRRISTAPSPEEAFLAALRAAAPARRQGGLGLARIAHEGGCDVAAEVVGDTVVVRAVTRSLESPAPGQAPAV